MAELFLEPQLQIFQLVFQLRESSELPDSSHSVLVLILLYPLLSFLAIPWPSWYRRLIFALSPK
jgi:hypothetical protein